MSNLPNFQSRGFVCGTWQTKLRFSWDYKTFLTLFQKMIPGIIRQTRMQMLKHMLFSCVYWAKGTARTIWGNCGSTFFFNCSQVLQTQAVFNGAPFYPLEPAKAWVNGYFIETGVSQGLSLITLSYLMHCCIELHPATYWQTLHDIGRPERGEVQMKSEILLPPLCTPHPHLHARYACSLYSKRILNTWQINMVATWTLMEKS